MSDFCQSKEQLIEELAALRLEVAELQTIKTAFNAQNELLRSLVAMLQTANGTLLLRAMLQQTLQIARGLTSAEEGSLFLLDDSGFVTESILARGATIRGQKQRLIGEVLDKGLAGWVFQHRQVGLISDTLSDERWLTLTNQPYIVRSALGIPILKGKSLLGILTLMHSLPGHFNQESARLMQMTAAQMALILDNVQLHTKHHQADKTSHLQVLEEQLSNKEEEFAQLGIYIIFGEGNFLYANPRFAEIFGYTFGELISLESVLNLVSIDQRRSIADLINKCIQGQNKSIFCQFPGQRKDGSIIDAKIYGTRTKLYGKYVVIGALKES
jgi:PAS domain S-box-containing protein